MTVQARSLTQADVYQAAPTDPTRAVTSISTVLLRDVHYRPITPDHAAWLALAADDAIRAYRPAPSSIVGARASKAAIEALVSVLLDPAWTGTPRPFISPTEADGIVAEFRSESGELQLEFDANGVGTIYVLDANGFEWEGPIEGVPDGIDKWAWRLSLGR